MASFVRVMRCVRVCGAQSTLVVADAARVEHGGTTHAVVGQTIDVEVVAFAANGSESPVEEHT